MDKPVRTTLTVTGILALWGFGVAFVAYQLYEQGFKDGYGIADRYWQEVAEEHAKQYHNQQRLPVEPDAA